MTEDKQREARLRSIAQKRGMRIEKSRSRDPDAADFGGCMLVDTETNTVVVGGYPYAYSASLDDVEEFFKD